MNENKMGFSSHHHHHHHHLISFIFSISRLRWMPLKKKEKIKEDEENISSSKTKSH
jgi:hypothetical protein